MEGRFKPDAAGTWFDEADLAWRMNEYDEYAVEEAVRLREKSGDEADLTVLSVGPDRVVETLRKALAMGCDRAVHLRDDQASSRDPWQIASLIAAFARDKDFDLVFTGMQSQDRASAQVGLFLAGILDYAAVTTIVSFEWKGDRMEVRRELEGGKRALLSLGPPALLTCQLGLNTPRYPTLPNIMKARKKELSTIEAATLGIEMERTSTTAFAVPGKKSGCLVLEGEPPALVEKLVTLLRDRTTVMAGRS
jgi:electron transfer flavoprotein beta subunit